MLKILPLRGFPNCSQWGRVGTNSCIFPFLKEDKYLSVPLAELWFGTHKNGLSTLLVAGESLSLREYLKDIEELPYLAKILSVDAPLSIQLHPPIEIAKKLHAVDPKNYPDSNPKPEMSIAITEVELLCGMRRVEEIRSMTNSQPAFDVLGVEFKRLLSLGDLRGLADFIFKLETRVLVDFTKLILNCSMDDPWTRLVKKLTQIGTEVDPGFVFLYFLEYLKLMPGEAIFIEPSIPHAYISGDMFECMQSSDNVVRGGLTPKYIDKENFVGIFCESYYDPRLGSESIDGVLEHYKPVGCPFSVRYIQVDRSVELDLHKNSLIINLSGHGSLNISGDSIPFHEASSFFIPKDVTGLTLNPSKFLQMFIVEPN